MQTTPSPSLLSASEQVPILRADQMRVGAFVTGAAMEYLWEVVALHGGGNTMDIIEFPRVAPPCAGHTFATYGRGEKCQCGLRRIAIAEFLPRKPDKPRAYILQTRGELRTPMEGAIYAHLSGQELAYCSVVNVHMPSNPGEVRPDYHLQWDHSIPIFPSLLCAWSVPPALQALCHEGEIVNGESPIANDVPF